MSSTGNHNGVASLEDAVESVDGLGALNLRDDVRLHAEPQEDASCRFHVAGAGDRGECHIVRVDLRRELQRSGALLVGKGLRRCFPRGGHSPTFGEPTAPDNLTHDVLALHGRDLELDQTVVQQDGTAHHGVPWIPLGDTDTTSSVPTTSLLVRTIDAPGCSSSTSCSERPDSVLGARYVHHQSDGRSQALRDPSHTVPLPLGGPPGYRETGSAWRRSFRSDQGIHPLVGGYDGAQRAHYLSLRLIEHAWPAPARVIVPHGQHYGQSRAEVNPACP